jgi:HTH-type transcriptional repressor of NAD biosynthesis genes
MSMKRGLVIGKFMPIHLGHVALIKFAASQCNELIVSMSFTESDVIDASLRFSWIREIFKDSPSIKPFMIADDFDDESLILEKRTEAWAIAIRKTYPKIDLVISSEKYGPPFAKHLGAECKDFDPDRKTIPISASMIRSNPFAHWQFIPEVVKPFFVKKICLYGPESTGKSTMAKRLAEIYNTEFVPEVAREFITANDFTADDIIKIGKAQTERINEKIRTANKILFCDTDLITTEVYSQYYLQMVPQVIYELEKQVKYDQYLLFSPDVAWVSDGLRDLGNQREVMYEIFRNELDKRKIKYLKVEGDYAQREKIIRTEVDRLLNNN